jgi:hypothetical protein
LKVSPDSSESVVPEAVGRTLQVVMDRIGVEKVDRVWIFPPLVRGRKEWGLVAVSGLSEDSSQRVLYTARYSAELMGTGSAFQSEVTLEGTAPPDRLPRVMEGVVRRSDLPLGDPKEVEILGDPVRFRALVQSYGWELPRERTGEHR